MAHQIEYKIIGESLQLVEIELDPNEGVRAEPGGMTYMEDGIEMETGAGGGLLGGLKRMVAGESFFIITYQNTSNAVSKVAFAAPYPGRVVPLDLTALGGSFMCQNDSFLCAAIGIEIEVAFTKRLGAGLFGGEGFILQKLTGDGLAFAHAGGMIIERDLKEGETLRVRHGLPGGVRADCRLRYPVHRRIQECPLRRGGVVLCQDDRTGQGLPAESAAKPDGRPDNGRRARRK